MNFLHPGWLSLLLILPFILLGAILAFRSQRQTWKKMVAPRLRKQLVKTSSPTRRWIALGLGLCGCALLIVALTRPYLGETTTTEQIASRNIIIAIDTSRSMLVRDGAPDRMSTAKAMGIEVLEAFPNDRVGVIAFSGTSVLMAPLTVDHGAVQETISQLDTDVISSGGSDLSSAVSTAIEAFKKTGQKTNALIIISDGEHHSAAISLAAEKIRKSHTIVCSIGVGTDEGGLIPDNQYRDGKFRDNNGRTVHSKMSSEALDTLARAGQGSYTPARSGSISAISSALSSLKRSEQVGRQTVVPNEYFQWFLVPAILLLILSTIIQSEFLADRFSAPKKTSLPSSAAKLSTIILLFTLFLTGSGYTATVLQQAEESYSNGEYEKALKLFTQALPDSQGEDRRAIQFSIGSTAYKLEQWEESNNYLSEALLAENATLQEQAHYNLGNSLFMTGWSQLQAPEPEEGASPNPSLQAENRDLAITSLEDAISHYQAALNIRPENTNASDNLKEAEKILEQLNQEKEQQEKEEQEQENEEEQKDKSEDQEQQEGEGDPKEKEGEGDESEQDSESDQQGEQGEQSDKNKKPGEGEGEGEEKDQEPSEGEDEGDEQKPSPKKQQAKQSEPKNAERGENETEEEHAARVLEENSDAETRPIQRRFRPLRRPAKDW